MAERPILFSGPMVRAILDGTKTQTRRILSERDRIGYPHGEIRFACDEYFTTTGGISFGLNCPYGKPGDRLWVREAWKRGADDSIYYRADGHIDVKGWPWKPSIHMPRRASRITLEITEVRAQRLQEITEDDALAEGSQIPMPNIQACWTERQAFSQIWNFIYGKTGPWSSNPWVWAVTFRRCDRG